MISIRLYKMAFQEWQTGMSCALAYIVLIMVLAITNIYVEISEQSEGTLRWPLSVPVAKGPPNRLAIVSVLIITMIFLAPIYWIASTAFKPRNLATTIPPTVIFTAPKSRLS